MRHKKHSEHSLPDQLPTSGCAEEQLALNIGGLFSIIDALHENAAIVSRTGVLLWVTSCFERTYGLPREQVIGRTTYELEEARIFYPSVAALVLRTGKKITITETNQTGHYNIVTGVPIFDSSGEIAFVVSFTVDPRYSAELYVEYEKINALLMDNALSGPAPAIPDFVSTSEAMQNIVDTIGKLAKVDTNVLITGESGVGKNVLARHLHSQSHRQDGPLIEINCAGIPATLLESELFGYEAGAFTGALASGKPGRFELAHNGTLFLDEIGELPLPLQAKLLHVIQEKKLVKIGGTKQININFRLVAATNQDLSALVAKKRFRKDLYFRLNVFPVHIPPLRERVEDVVPLCRMILDGLNCKYNTQKRLSPALEQILCRYSWPGNVRELSNLVEQMVVVSNKKILDVQELPEHIYTSTSLLPGLVTNLPNALEELEGQIVRETYARCHTTVATAKALGISQPSAARKIAKYCHGQEKAGPLATS